MRLYEIASAEDQLALLRLIIDNTWSAVSQQAEQERRMAASKKASPTPSSKPIKAPYASAPKPLPKPKQPDSKQQAPKPPPPMLHKDNTISAVRNTAKPMPNPFLNPNLISPNQASIVNKNALLGVNGSATKMVDIGKDGHSKIGIR